MGLPVELVMTRDVVVLRPDMSLIQADRTLLQRHVSGAPVVEGSKLVGVMSRADAVRVLYEDQREAARISDFYTSPLPIPLPALELLAKDSQHLAEQIARRRVGEIMTSDPITVGPLDDLETVANLMSTERIHRLPVVDDDELVGIVTSLDVVRMVALHGLGAAR